jgi:hypothetical protein
MFSTSKSAEGVNVQGGAGANGANAVNPGETGDGPAVVNAGSVRFDAFHTEADLEHFFPIWSQCGASDKLFLLGAMRLVREAGAYKYLEIGSYLGGSLTPFLMDPACETVFSIDDRGRIQPDERGISYDYTDVTTQRMLDGLHRKGISTEKLKTFDGSINATAIDAVGMFDLSLIDGEHTDEACFRDFIWTFPLMKSDSVIIFHDSSLIYKVQKLILIYLDKAKVDFVFFKRTGSEMAALILGKFCARPIEAYLGQKEDQSMFFANSEAKRIKSQFLNRVRPHFVPSKMLNWQIPLKLEIVAPAISDPDPNRS